MLVFRAKRKEIIMYKFLPITDVYAREILDSRGNPTVEVEVLAGDKYYGRASVPLYVYYDGKSDDYLILPQIITPSILSEYLD